MPNDTSSGSGSGSLLFQPVVLTPLQKQKWEDTMSMMMWTCPGYRHLFYKLLANNDGDYAAVMTEEADIACTDAKNIMVNPKKFFENYSLPERVFIIAQEVQHNVFGDVEYLNHCNQTGLVPMEDGTSLPFDNLTMQKALDRRINALLVESKIGKCPKDAIEHGFLVPEVTAMDGRAESYRKTYEELPEPDKGGKGKGPGSGKGAFDKLMPPGASQGKNPQQAAQERNQQQWGVEIAAAQNLESMKSQGSMSAALKRMFQQILEPEIPWTDHIQGIVHRKVGSGGKDWRRPDRRFIGRDLYLPSNSGYGANWIVCWGDTSGSRSDSEIASNMAELSGILEQVRPKRLTILWCDAEIKYVDELEDAMDLAKIQARGTGGGGGTSVHPVMEWIHDNGYEPPDMFIGFTDGYVTFPSKEPDFPVIWASSTDHTYPWGDVVRVNKVNRNAQP